MHFPPVALFWCILDVIQKCKTQQEHLQSMNFNQEIFLSTTNASNTAGSYQK